MTPFDKTDARILLVLANNPRATGVEVASILGLSRNTVQARMNRWHNENALAPMDARVKPAELGHPVLAFVTMRVDQHKLSFVTEELRKIVEVIEVFGLSGESDLLVRIAAADTDDLYRVAGLILDIPGVERTNMGIAMKELVPYRTTPLLEQIAGARP
ncbi:DNA-binding Lrp family transcriptional regulator [Rhodococcus sp. 27YEA15]|uniref:Lrp/AsnC family transcriptional regulator n=1 Tax=Rhodococcus sp. 27YEA15 TaxID=3156259 RepID=UPI003C7AF838